jgi:hypothetical protein
MTDFLTYHRPFASMYAAALGLPQDAHRPQRHPRDREIVTIVDLLTVKAEEMAERGDDTNARRLDAARRLVVDVALGVPQEERG